MQNLRLIKRFSHAAAVAASVIIAGCAGPAPDEMSAKLSGVGAVSSDPMAGQDAPEPLAMIPAPELFAATGTTVWDGRRTLRGLWVAHPDVQGPMDVTVRHSASGRTVRARALRALGGAHGNITVSSELATGLGLEPGRRAMLSVVGLRPDPGIAGHERNLAEARAKQLLGGHLATLDRNRLGHIVAAALRGLGYAPMFVHSDDGTIAAIRAESSGLLGQTAPAMLMTLRTGAEGAAPADEIARLHETAARSGNVAGIVAIGGIEGDADQGMMLDGRGLMDLWTEIYDRLPATDKALLPLQPVYFLAAN